MTKTRYLAVILLANLMFCSTILAQDELLTLKGKLVSTTELFGDVSLETETGELGYAKSHSVGFKDFLLLPSSTKVYSDTIHLRPGSDIYLVQLDTKTSENLFNQAINKNLGKLVQWNINSDNTIHYVKYVSVFIIPKEIQNQGKLILNYFGTKTSIQLYLVKDIISIEIEN